MAAASHLNIAPSKQKPSFGITKPAAWQPSPLTMHVTRPKSAKGRTRSNLSFSHSVEAYSYQVPASPQPLAPCHDAAGGRRASSSQQLSQPLPVFPAEIPDLLQQVPMGTSSSLNKYRVLPSISRKEMRAGTVEVMSDQIGQLQGSAQTEEEEWGSSGLPAVGKGPTPILTQHKGGSGEYAQVPPPPLERKPFSKISKGTSAAPALNLDEPCEKEPRLLLAIRSPSGQRFEHHFRPMDSLKTILAVAEQKNSAVYKHCSIETAEVPRRTFSDLTKSLQECAIVHKSVLCILQEEQEGAL
ncbi:UBX domain-containing protein 10 [Varanus komodoensis]|uniref:UBX domain-containing protein 10 n=1 Tax=Varanus komodoensis TaxID=61221 RepID=UPI001CF7C0FD|nr:UBX domain-containing protein 10 [Varanus komodoensis]XP_044308223.1 UBX domain-containing protein 10 [Varanus komodoensis]XP_044308224.1 UBX domain-containing protein 10 [Varanus komodoensis]XP_044308225.1 UBX domain-containing protein 10 [Varanus komodoensis]